VEILKQNNFEKLTLLIFFSIVGLVPLLVFPAASDQSLSIKYLALKIIVITMIFFSIIKVFSSGIQVRRSGLEIAIIIYACLMVAATALSGYRYTSLEGAYTRYDGLYSQIIYVGIFFFAIQYLRKLSDLKRFIKISIATGSVVSLYGLLQAAGIDPVPWGLAFFEGKRSFATFGNPILLASYLSILLPLSIGMFFESKSKQQKVVYILSSTLIGICLFSTMSRAAWVGVFVGVLVQFVLMGRAKLVNKQKLAISLMSIVIVIILAASLFLGANVLLARAGSIVNTDQSFANRLVMWESAVRIIKDNLLFGCGPDALAYTFPRYESVKMAREAPNQVQTNVHNIYLQLAATSGIPALMAFLIIIAILFLKANRYLNSPDSEQNQQQSFLVSSLVGGISAYLIQGIFGLSGIETSTFLWLFMGVLASYLSENGRVIKPVTSKSIKGIVLSISFVIAVLAIYNSTTVFVSDYFLGNARNAKGNAEARTALIYYQQAITYNNSDEKAPGEMGLYLAEISQANKDKRLWKAGIDSLKEAVSKNPNNHLTRLALGHGYLYGAKIFDKNYYELSELNLKKAIALRPHAPLALAMLGVVYYDTGRISQAEKSLAKAIDINPKDPQAHYYYGLCFEKIGKQKLAKHQYAATLEIDSSHEKAQKAYLRLTRQGF
jgi:putative inorganic carbon (HCO3(-)) transporter